MARRSLSEMVDNTWVSSSPLVSQDSVRQYLGIDDRAFRDLLTAKRLVRHASGAFLREQVESVAKEIRAELLGLRIATDETATARPRLRI